MLKSIIQAIQVTQATRRIVKYLTSNNLLDPTKEQYFRAVFFAVKDIRLTVRERRVLVESLTKLKDRVVQESAKKIKP